MIKAIIGLSKNSGKTSVLNHILQTRENELCGVFTTGRDGEELDLVENTEKPKVALPQNCFYTTFDYEVKKQSLFVEIISKLPFKSSGKNLWLVRTNSDIQAEVVGPQTKIEQMKLAKMMQNMGAKDIFIDGSLNRKTIVAFDSIDETIVVGGASFGSIKEIKNEFARLTILSRIKRNDNFNQSDRIVYSLSDKVIDTGLSSLFGNTKEIFQILKLDIDWIYFPGALTDRIYNKLESGLTNKTIILQHPINIYLNYKNFKKLLSK
ncbi:MAG: hypothetical protein U9N34_08925, partial [Candidatus Cloacimonadota bacterium]|nr:hypothetical protein [Candidatus Cloacimonadota bacterium]